MPGRVSDRSDRAGWAGSALLPTRRWGRLRPGSEPAIIFLSLCAGFLVIASWRSPDGLQGSIEHIRGAAGDYLVTAEVGYPTGTWRVATFPGFSLAIRAAHELGIGADLATTSVVVAFGGGLATCLVMWGWMKEMGLSLAARRLGLVALLLSPAGFVLLATPQSESVFLPLAIGACLAVERRRPFLAAGLLVAASATRLSAALFVICAVITGLERDGVLAPSTTGSGRLSPRSVVSIDVSRVRPRHLIPALGLVGMLSYFAYTWRWHHSLRLLRAAGSTHQRRTAVASRDLGPLGARRQPPGEPEPPRLPGGDRGEHPPTVLVAACTPSVVRRFGFGYGVLVAGHVLMIWFMAYDFASASRYLLGAFPVFALAGLAASDGRRFAQTVIALSAIVCVVFGTMHPNGVTLA
jgi:hypothetical protein